MASIQLAAFDELCLCSADKRVKKSSKKIVNEDNTKYMTMRSGSEKVDTELLYINNINVCMEITKYVRPFKSYVESDDIHPFLTILFFLHINNYYILLILPFRCNGIRYDDKIPVKQ